MVDLSRRVAEGALPGNEDQRAEALRLLGIGLYLSGRQDGAERAFVDLVRLRPQANLDPTITRPEVVIFFRDVKRRSQPQKQLIRAFLPPLGQFQNDTPGRGWVLAAALATTFTTALTTRLVLEAWDNPNRTCRGRDDPTPCNRLKVANVLSVAALATTWAIGVIDALLVLRHTTEPPSTSFPTLTLLPTGATLQVSF